MKTSINKLKTHIERLWSYFYQTKKDYGFGMWCEREEMKECRSIYP